MSIVDISGYSFTGKSAVYDLLSGLDEFVGFGSNFEFELIRAPGGLLDLQTALCGEHWSPVRSSDGIRRFLNLIEVLGGDKSLIDRFCKLGNQYDYYFPDFTAQSIQFIDKLTSGKWHAYWPYSKFHYNRAQVIAYKVLSRIGFKQEDIVYLSRVTARDFEFYVKTYLDELFQNARDRKNRILILNNAFEPFKPVQSARLISSAKAVIVDRDPRDIYLSALYSSKSSMSRIGSSVIGKSAQDFIDRFRIYRDAVVINDDDASIFRMRFEDLVLESEKLISQLLFFLGVDSSATQSKLVFDPKKSSKNVGMWKKVEDQKVLNAIALINSELSDFCIE